MHSSNQKLAKNILLWCSTTSLLRKILKENLRLRASKYKLQVQSLLYQLLSDMQIPLAL